MQRAFLPGRIQIGMIGTGFCTHTVFWLDFWATRPLLSVTRQTEVTKPPAVGRPSRHPGRL